ncbi:MAG: glutamine-hydrolyzing carbamoyl-phosphate synthase small subunit [Microthrixaceae bacterium]|nr:glutamine-hydrolyzing carbamoyl-phosphate synthase small subunit [Microthrixaceae bacterium]
MSEIRTGHLVLANGDVFEGELFGAAAPGGVVTGEIVFNTVMSGYQEVISDPSYAGQIITFTTAHLGNYGTNGDDDEATTVHCRGVVLREMARRHSNWRSGGSLEDYLVRHGIAAIGGVDTRRLTRVLREGGAMPGAFGDASVEELTAAAKAAVGTDGCDLVSEVTCAESYTVEGNTARHVVAVDCGIKATIVDCLSEIARVTVVPSTTTADEIRALAPDGVFLSNGPGDPAAVTYLPDTIKSLLGEVPIFGICMGHQLLGTAVGGSTHKLPFGHHGGNHPIKEIATGKVEITSQNHNYCVSLDGVEGVEVTHVNLNDDTLAGFRCTDVPAFGIQYHPEAGPGPHDSRYLFERFAELIDAN